MAGRPMATKMVGRLTADARARSLADQPRRAISPVAVIEARTHGAEQGARTTDLCWCRRDRTNPSRLSRRTAIRHGEPLEAAVDFYALSGRVPASSLQPFRPPTRVAFDLLGREDISAGPYG
jgi:hypothetical protein